ncbi:GcrA family cell cycle regulator [Bradyrhizobium japonicum]|uniref:GcrA-like regulator n=1 Tax=Bradyrhizobium japonicum TaxID=375 RepID=A0A0A3YMJ5_BRAJP|nr:GcrA family cell cycle regulator [Bradyrhizobium japonicum]KGT74918.1 GcrA-like regulator [Bradyrhizobium japonicum]MCS3895622.1 GcrA cell cycle regulator [Bradyrhizobium japonicum USDA 38]MCS3948137.1 GcrA cell cycle regulator [Bradyrhizobium japonicum]MCW2219072.1 GcrA cell cycle regulator [Bradyrhizobium japonicum]MCW2343686.1 GcrA cell cycle regulator [Bradyrhizobium japonicum]
MPVLSPTSSSTASSPTWTNERIELLKQHFEAGLTCSEIAADIGVSRNAVIGKLSRLNLTRGRTSDERKLERSLAPRRGTRAVPRLQYEMLATIYGDTDTPVVAGPIDDANRCSLLELSENCCRWPISTPGADDFCFCGNTAPDGQPYCVGHSRLAYRPNSRARVMRG